MEKISFELKKTMAQNIECHLKKADKTQRDMCKDLAFKENTVSDWLNAKTYPRIDKIEMMANYFGCKKSDLIESATLLLSSDLTKMEQELLFDFRQLNLEGQEKGCGYIHDLTEIPKYKPNSSAAEPAVSPNLEEKENASA